MGEKFRFGPPSGWRLASARRQGPAADPEADLAAGTEPAAGPGAAPVKVCARAVLVAEAGEPEPLAVPGRFGWLRRLRLPSRGARSWAPVVGKAVAGAGITAVVGIVAVVLGLYGLPELAALRSGGDLSSPSGTALPTGFPPVPAPSLPAAGAVSPGPGATPGPIFATPQAGQASGAAVQPGGRPSDALAPWASNLSRLGIPQVALQAYAYAELVIGRTQPSCKLSWTLLAGIGSVESNHGRHAGAKLQQDGTSIPKIVGIPLDGT
ncbi:MAG: hypothetical protein QOI35_1859, partial [Cryptosporangiaceae bacterium]|nr:hypothetical protein [Cryptosporangiaceae bacterium]